ncbi:MAG: hypothetical protein NVSMB2_02970 [Chloroflexota bacterium]
MRRIWPGAQERHRVFVSVAQREAQDVAVEGHRAIEIADPQSDVSELRRYAVHGASVVPPARFASATPPVITP